MNEEKQIVGINESIQLGTPVLFIGKTKNSIQSYFNQKLSSKEVRELNRIIISEQINLVELCRVVEKYRTIRNIWIGPAYLSQINAHDENGDNGTIIMTERNSHFLSKHFKELIPTIKSRSPVVGYIADGNVISVCCSARKSDTAAEASLLTVEQYRGHGFAQLVVHRWSRQVEDVGLIPLYSTSWDNISSQRIAQKLSMIQYGVDFSITTE